MLPRQTDEVEAGDVGDAAAVTEAAVAIKHREIHPGVVGSVPGGPDHGVEFLRAAVGECDGPAGGADDARPERDAVLPHEFARARPDEGIAVADTPAEPRVGRRIEHSELRQPPEDVAAKEPLRQGRLARPNRELNGVTRRQLFCDLEAGVTPADDQDAAAGDVARTAVAGAVRLEDLGRELPGERGRARLVERAGGDDHLVGHNRPPVSLDPEGAVLVAQRRDGGVESDRKFEPRRVLVEVAGHFVACRIAVGVPGKGESGKGIVAPGGKEDEGVPTAPPRRADGAGGFEDHEMAALAGKEVADRQAGLPGADHDDVETGRRRGCVRCRWCGGRRWLPGIGVVGQRPALHESVVESDAGDDSGGDNRRRRPVDHETKRRPPAGVCDELPTVLPQVFESVAHEADDEQPR